MARYNKIFKKIKKMKKYILLLIWLSFPLVSFSTTEIKFWQFWSAEWMQPLIDKFEKENPDIQVSLERLTWSDGQNKIITAFAANQAPDVLEIGSTWVAGFSQDGGLKAIDPKGLLKNYLIGNLSTIMANITEYLGLYQQVLYFITKIY